MKKKILAHNNTKVLDRKKIVRKAKKVTKAEVKKNIVKTHGKNREENAPEIIFDSEVGKTDALFVDEPKPEIMQPEEIKLEEVKKVPWWKRIFSK